MSRAYVRTLTAGIPPATATCSTSTTSWPATVAVEMRVVRLDGDLAVCEDAGGDVRKVEVALLDGVTEGDTLLVHADVALVRT